ncbi:MAG: sigma 54-interacting transcriptional regulator [Planctomycetota bacterium]
MRKILIAWVGKADLRAPTEADVVGLGPIAQALDTKKFAELWLLADYPKDEVAAFVKWLRARTSARIEVLHEKLSGPTEFGEIYEAAIRGVTKAIGDRACDTKLTFHLSPGTPAMAAVWILLGKTRFPADLLESSRQQGVRVVSVPFDLSVDFLPDLMRERDERLRNSSAAEPPTAPEFKDIVHRSRPMERLIQRARRVALHTVPVLIEGESGTGKEMLARAIHQSSPRRERELIAVNCGAIPAELVESQLFGHEKGAFTDAKEAKKGFFEAANGGTLFLDEVGELPSAAQVKLLRVLQEGEVLRVGATKPIKVDVRIVAATNRTLTEEIASGRFREDLFYRLAVAVLKLPSLRDRSGDLGLLVDHLLSAANQEASRDAGFVEKKLSAGARNLLLSHRWPGNVRELQNTLRRALIWSEQATVSVEDMREALLPSKTSVDQVVLGLPLGAGFSLPQAMKDLAQHYLKRAMQEAHGNKTKAAELVGLPSYQTLTNWLTKYEVES